MYCSVRQHSSQPQFSGPGNRTVQTLYVQISLLYTAVRLVGGRNVSSQGRVELFYNGTWGTVCGYRWKLRDANVVCHQLGFEGAQSAYIQTVFGRGKGNSWYYDLRCIGNESSLTDCGQRVWYSSSCGHSNVADVVCRTGTKSYKTVNLFTIILFC